MRGGGPPSISLNAEYRCLQKIERVMIERSIVAIEDMKQSVAELLPGTMSNLARETAIEVLAQLQSVMLERKRLLKELTELGWRQ